SIIGATATFRGLDFAVLFIKINELSISPSVAVLPNYATYLVVFALLVLLKCYSGNGMATYIKVGERWRAQVRIKGHKPVARTFDKKAQAVAWATKAEDEIRSGGFADARALADFTIPSLVTRYEEEFGPFRKSKRGALKMLRRHMKNDSLASLDDVSMIAYAKRRNAMGAGGVTIGLELNYLSGLLTVARTVWKIPFRAQPVREARPALKMLGLLSKSKERDRRPTSEEIEALCRHFDGKARQVIPMSDIIRFAVATAMRASEITSLLWDDLDSENRTIVIRDRKHPEEKIGNNQTVPLLGEAFEIASRQPRRGPFVFPYNAHSFSSIFPRACGELKIVDLRFHDLRHEGVSRLFEQGYRIEQVALVSGHRDWKMLRRYTQVRARDLHRDFPVSTGE
ncbi:site-specific integrase, partial [Paraburkholderia caffeinitolerans]